MLDELGNLQSEGHGISGFETMLSIGLGQEQQFTLILQTLQQLKDVYGDSVDKIVQGNTSNIVFLKSTDDSMIETLSKMSGTTHVSYRDSKTVTKDVTSIMKMTANEGKVSYTISTAERPVIAYNDFAQIPPCNSIVFRAGDFPIWNRNETALPMSWRLFKNTIVNPGKDYSLQTIPSLSTAKDFDVKQNQPNFTQMFEKRVKQAVASIQAVDYYKAVYGLNDDEIQRLDVDVYSDAIMEMVSQIISPELDMTKREEKADKSVLDREVKETPTADTAKQDDSVQRAMQEDPRIRKAREMDRITYACGMLKKSDLMSPAGQVSHAYDTQISAVYVQMFQKFNSDPLFRVDPVDKSLRSRDGDIRYIYWNDNSGLRKDLEQKEAEGGRVVDARDPGAGSDERVDLTVTDEFIKFLCSFDRDWDFCRGEFSQMLARALKTGSE